MPYPKVLVVIPTKNAGKTLEKCLQSVCALDYPNYDVVVVDANSTDRTHEIVKRFKKVKLVVEPLTIAGAYNYALRKFKHLIFALTDADCIVPKNWLKLLVPQVKGDVAAAGGFYKTAPDSNIFSRLVGLEFDARSKRFSEYVSRLNTGNLVISRDIALKIGGFDEILGAHQDADFGYTLRKNNYKMRYVSEADVYHYHRSSLGSFFKQQYWYGKEMPKVYFKHRKMIKGDHITSFWMGIQPFVISLLLALSGLAIFQTISIQVPLLTFLAVLMVYVLESLSLFIKTRSHLSLCLPVIYLVRAVAWTLGGFSYMINSVIDRIL